MQSNERAIDRLIAPKVGGYPVNYGFVPQTISYDGDPFDILVLGPPLAGGSLVRGIIVDNDKADAVQRIRNVKVYPWSEREAPTPNKFVSISGGEYDTTPPGGMEYWARLANVINNNPVQGRDRFFMAMLDRKSVV